jgi:hypothetical protein
MQMIHNGVTRRRVRKAVKTTRKAMNRALDRAEPRLEEAAVALEGLRRDTARKLREQSAHGVERLRTEIGRVETRVLGRTSKKMRRQTERHPGRATLVAIGLVAIIVGLMRR